MNPSLFLVFIFAAATIFALVKIVAPFLEDRDAQLRFEVLDEELREIEELVARKSVLLQGLKDIEFDYETGKLSEEDYERLREKNERQAVQVMRKLDDLRGDVDLDEAIDSALERRLQERARTVPADRSAETPDPEQETPATIECPECGKRLEAEARFCSRCGRPLDDEEQTASDDASAGSDASDDVDGSNGSDDSDPSDASDELDDVDELDESDDSETIETDFDREPDGEPNERAVSDLRSEATG